jgi:hypothetical protein
LHSTPFFLHLYLLLEHFDIHEHLKNPWPPDKDCWDAASWTLIDVSQLSSSCKIKSCLQILISLAPNMPLNRPYRVPITAFPLSFTWKTNRETRTKRIENTESKLLLFLRFVSHLIIVVFWLRPNKIYVLFLSLS